MAAVSKGKASGLPVGLRRAGQALAQVVVGGFCGVGLAWAVTATWPPGARLVTRLGHQIEAFSGQYPAVIVGLLIGIMATLVWQSARK